MLYRLYQIPQPFFFEETDILFRQEGSWYNRGQEGSSIWHKEPVNSRISCCLHLSH